MSNLLGAMTTPAWGSHHTHQFPTPAEGKAQAEKRAAAEAKAAAKVTAAAEANATEAKVAASETEAKAAAKAKAAEAKKHAAEAKAAAGGAGASWNPSDPASEELEKQVLRSLEAARGSSKRGSA
jgi:hypothetical protein